MTLPVKRWLTFVEQTETGAGDVPLRKIAVVAVIANPHAGRHVENLSDLIDASGALGAEMAKWALDSMKPYRAVSYGKGGLVGLAGEQEHINALLTTAFAEPVRSAIGGGKAWISSMTKRCAPGATIDIPLAHKDALYVRSHYDGITFTLHDAPHPDEIAVILALANRGRINARVGGLSAEEIEGQDGLR